MEDGKWLRKPKSLMKAQYTETPNGEIQFPCGEIWNLSMEDSCPESGIIEVIYGIWEDGDGNQWQVVPEMFYGPYFDWGEECEVRDHNAAEWKKVPFHGYTHNGSDDDNFIHAGDTFWRQIRRPQKEQMSHEEVAEEYVHRKLDNYVVEAKNHVTKEIVEELIPALRRMLKTAHADGRKSMESEE